MALAAASPAPASASATRTIPVVETDFIFAADRRGARPARRHRVLIAFMLLVGAGCASRCGPTTPFEKLLAAGLTTLLGMQAFIIIGGVTRLLPLTGVTLPFVSYGGSSLVANYVLLALLLRISDDTARRAERTARAPSWREGDAHEHTRFGGSVSFLMACYVALFVQLNYIQVIKADD